MNLQSCWEDFKLRGCQKAREKIIIEYLSLVKYIAHRMAINFPSFIMIDDIINDGILGLIQAVETYDPAREIDFKVYASFRIRGAILDALRAFDWAPRSLRKKSREFRDVMSQLETELGRIPSNEEIAEYMKVSVSDLDKLISNLGSTAILSLDAWLTSSEDGKTFQDVCDSGELSPDQFFDRKELIKTMAGIIDSLPTNERLVITLYYYEELTLKEISGVLELSESRISQLHTRAVLRIKEGIKKFFPYEEIPIDYKYFARSSSKEKKK